METSEKNKLYVKDRDIVVPGDFLAEGMNYLPSGKAVREKDKIYATTVGLAVVKGRVIKVIPLSGRYIPQKNDMVIGVISEIGKFGWRVDINSPFDADLNDRDVSSFGFGSRTKPHFNIGDVVLAGIFEITEKRFVKLTMRNRPYRKLREGILIEVSPSKIPRIIGKAGSMINTLKDGSGCDILVGQNGIVWIKGEPTSVKNVIAAIKIIEEESHTEGLTKKISGIFSSGSKSSQRAVPAEVKK